MLYKIPDGSYIDLNCIQSLTPEYEKHISLNDDNALTTPHNSNPCSYLISLDNGQQLEIKPKDFKTFKKALIKKGLIVPDEEEK